MPLVGPAAPYVIAIPEPDNSPPRVKLILEWGTVSTNLVRIDPGGEAVPVREAQPTVTWSGTHAIVYDYESPFGVPIRYRMSSGSSSYSSAEIVLDAQKPWIRHPINPAVSMQIDLQGDTSVVYAVNRASFDVIGRRTKVAVTDGRRKAKSATIMFRTYSLNEIDSVLDLFEDSQVLLLDVPPSYGWGIGHQYCSFGDLTEARTTERLYRIPYREWSAPYDVVDRPALSVAGPRTWTNVTEEATSWNAVVAKYEIWNDVVTGVES